MRNPRHVQHAHERIHKTPTHKLIYVASIAYPLTTLPQIIHIYTEESAQDLSPWSWSLYLVFALIFLSYGLSQRLKPIILLESLWVIVYTVMIIGIFIYK